MKLKRFFAKLFKRVVYPVLRDELLEEIGEVSILGGTMSAKAVTDNLEAKERLAKRLEKQGELVKSVTEVNQQLSATIGKLDRERKTAHRHIEQAKARLEQ